MNLYYMAHPYTCKDKEGRFVPEGEDANFHLSNYRASRLMLLGYNIYSPISHTHPIHRACPEFLARHEHKMWYQLDIALIEKTDFNGIILCPGWENSKGCKLEKDWFVKKGKEILFYTNLVKQMGIK